MEYETAGDPVSGLKWTHRTTQKIAEELLRFGIKVGPRTVARLLDTMGYSLRVNQKKIALSGKGNKEKRENRNKQYNYIQRCQKQFVRKKLPAISIDTKKKELIGNFKNGGCRWGNNNTNVNDHDFPSWATGKVVPYGIYDLLMNKGYVYVGTSCDTAKFSADCIEKWWNNVGRKQYPHADEILILADNGGSNSSVSKIWKAALQKTVCNKHNIKVTVCHFPPGASKWNPIEHKLFSQISKNWAATPLRDYETVLKYIRTTKTKTGLKVSATLVKKKYIAGVKPTKEDITCVNIKHRGPVKKWNYTLSPK